MRSLRTRLLLAVSATTAAVLILLGIGIYVAVRGALVSEFDRSTLAKAKAIASLTTEDKGKIHFDGDDLQMPEFDAGNRPKQREYYEIWMEGKVVARSPGLAKDDLSPAQPVGAESERFGEWKLPGDVAGRMAVLRFVPAEEGEGEATESKLSRAVVMVARPAHEMEEVLDDVADLVMALGGAAIAVGCAAMWLVMRQAFVPVGALARRIGEMRVDALGKQLAMENVPSELEPVIGKLNDLLRRVDDAFVRERAFSADVAHELRTPLAGLITTLEVCRLRAREPEAYETAMDKSLAMAQRMKQLVENLLLLARAESNQVRSVEREVRLDLLLEESFALLRSKAEDRGVTVTWEVEKPLVMRSDPELLRLIVSNLLENAATYVDSGGRITIAAGQSPQPSIRISNTGSKVAAGDVGHLTERFWRADAARTDTGVHCGLGLAIVKRMSELLRLKLKMESEAGGEFRVQLDGPAD